MKPHYLLIGISLLLVIVVLFFAISSFTSSDQYSNMPTPVPTLGPDDGVFHYHEPPPPSPNPTYMQLIEEQPYRNMLPHYGETFLVEYKQSDEKIIITTLEPGNVPNRTALINQFRIQARNWLTENGANLNDLTIEYVPSIE